MGELHTGETQGWPSNEQRHRGRAMCAVACSVFLCPRTLRSALLIPCTGFQRPLAAISELQTTGFARARPLPCLSQHSPPEREARGNRASMASLLKESLLGGLHGFCCDIGVYSPCYSAAPWGLILVILLSRYSFIIVDRLALLVFEWLH